MHERGPVPRLEPLSGLERAARWAAPPPLVVRQMSPVVWVDGVVVGFGTRLTSGAVVACGQEGWPSGGAASPWGLSVRVAAPPRAPSGGVPEGRGAAAHLMEGLAPHGG